MTKKLLLGIVFLISINVLAQEKKKNWSVETNYSIVPADGFGGNDLLVNVGLKYKFLETNFLNLGVGVDAGHFIEDNPFFVRLSSNENIFIFQPKLVSEFKLPFSKRLKPTLGLGYSFFTGSFLDSGSFGGFNLNIGLTYAISSKWYVQFQYDFVSLSEINASEGFNNFRLGVGFKF